MTVDDRVETLEDEFKLMKGELKQTLTQVRDFLLSLKLPAPPEEDPQEVHFHEESHETAPTTPGADSGNDAPSPEPPEVPLEEPMFEQTEQDSLSPYTESEMAPPPQGYPPPPQGNPPPPQGYPPPPQGYPPPPQGNPPPPQGMPLENVPLQWGPPRDSGPAWQEEDSNLSMASACPPKGAPYKQFEEESKNKEKQPRKSNEDDIASDGRSRSPEVNLLANLICWVSDAKSKLGIEQLPDFLDVYGVSGNLSPEMKDFILYLAGILEPQPPDITSTNYWSKFITEQLSTFLDIHSINEQISPELKDSIINFTNAIVQQATAVTSAATSEKNAADVWRQLILELHGVLSYGGAELVLLKPGPGHFVKEKEQNKTEGNEDNPVKLKLVFPNGKGVEREFSINLSPELDAGV